MDTRKESSTGEPVRLVAGRSTVMKESGLNLAVAAMRVGERAWVYVQQPRYGFGDAGSFSFPAVPPGALLVYDVELLAWEEAKEGDMKGMLYEERLEAAERRRQRGNSQFQRGEYKAALGTYAMALSYIDEDFMMQLDGFHLEQAEKVKLPIHLNMAACQIKIGDYNTAAYNCSEVLKLDAQNAKAMFRRGRARHLLGQTEGALADLEAAAKLAPDDKGVTRELLAVRHTIREERKAAAKLFKGQFGAAPAAAAAGGSSNSSSGNNIGKRVAVAKEGGARRSARVVAAVTRCVRGSWELLLRVLARLLGTRQTRSVQISG